MFIKAPSRSARIRILTVISFLVITSVFLSSCHTKSSKSTGSFRICEHVVISPEQNNDGGGFMLGKTHRNFHPWGVNYGHYGMLTEDPKSLVWDTLASDFRKIKNMGFNVVRMHLQFDQFMVSPDQPNQKALAGYKRLLNLARKAGLYLDITGLASYRPSYHLAWYDSLSESKRWAAQARFWAAVAKATVRNPVVFCFDLINEPSIPNKLLKRGGWYNGHLEGYVFGQHITLDPKGRPPDVIARQWIRQMTAAIRRYDEQTLITVGLLPWPSAFADVDSVASDLDYLSVHIYPKKAYPKAAMQTLEKYDVGKPVVIEETYPLKCGIDQWTAFMRKSRGVATGWLTHYLMPYSLKELKAMQHKTTGEALYQAYLKAFVKMKPQFSPGAVNCITGK